MFAVIRTGGKQYKVSPGMKLKVEKLNVPSSANDGGDVQFTDVLLVADDDVKIGAPTVPGAVVKTKMIKQGKAKKVIVFRFKAKKREKKKKGHRQPYTEVEILSISS
ncbi:50S ribosomal protein L21 [Candidatus Azambacteria bacterium]|nr:50S ribosomal protein L21 [Candidatus Azambacteria bacterium]MBI2588003.1 50S ribosomal protein L21 [Candidatus Azambacteria bacterium]